jgi:hypothetical protein
LNELKHGHIDLELTGFNDKFLEKLNHEDGEKALGANTTDELASELPGAQALKNDMVFPSSAKYGIPELRKDMLMGIPDDFETFAGWENIKGHNGSWLYIWATDVLRGLDFTKTIVGFYADDYRFECFWDQPAEYTGKLLNARVLGAISPNYSLWSSFPAAVKIWNTYRARWVTRYFQEAGIKVIPDVNHAEEASFDYCLEGIPKNAPAISIQIQTAEKNVEEIVIRRKAIQRIINELVPDSLLLYVGLNYEPIVEGIFPSSLKVCVLQNRLQRRAESIRENSKKLEKTSSAHKD